MTETCESCGMLIEEVLEEGRVYCSRCGDEDGKVLKITQPEVVERIKKEYFMEKMGLSEETALKQAEAHVNRQPAWQNIVDVHEEIHS